ncbi:uxu operon transcriptional regulator [Escherichia coli]|nr:uxu operon transcriptional regulator [Escherichia coli]
MMRVLLSCYRARQLLESNIAEFAALQATREDIVKMRQALQLEERELASSAPGSSGKR